MPRFGLVRRRRRPTSRREQGGERRYTEVLFGRAPANSEIIKARSRFQVVFRHGSGASLSAFARSGAVSTSDEISRKRTASVTARWGESPAVTRLAGVSHLCARGVIRSA